MPMGFDLKKGTDRNLASAMFSRASPLNIPESRMANLGDKVDEKKQKTDQFLEYTREAILILLRIVIVGSVLIAVIVAYLITRLTHATLFPIILRKGIEFLGPIFIKFGQWISTRRDIFPRDVCDTLSQLQWNATSHSWQDTEHLLESTYGPSWRDLFVRFDEEELIGSGCCAQVYKAWIDLDAADVLAARERYRLPRFIESKLESVFSSCTRNMFLSIISEKTFDQSDKFAFASPHTRKLQVVAVKVLHPGIEDRLKRDITIMSGLCKCALYFIPDLHWLSLTDCIDEFARIMENQVTLQHEYFLRFLYFLRNMRPILSKQIPLRIISSRRLTFIAISTSAIFKDNFIHCDLHPGNILVEKTAVPKTGMLNTFRQVITPDYVADDPRLIILDCGLVVSLDDRCRRNLRDVFYSVLMGNGEMAAQYILEHSSHMTPDPDGFKRSMKEIVKSHLRNPFNVSNTIFLTLCNLRITKTMHRFNL
ncbi:uncharacterized aarF domain-containing protein kinase 2 [Ooceraea biroi]|uniref:uncharacterized aarF domain-containing protein kinase 2 n=1 Tax=Ooceraea biroi TaxID=2015173 RepID=UPI000F0768EE|nr:uncharacterized aarF domain-containing protein kinase 2 [Ooceraea biroi]